MSSIPPGSPSSYNLSPLYNTYSREDQIDNAVDLFSLPPQAEEIAIQAEAPTTVSPVADLQITPDLDYTNLSNLILDKKLEEAIDLYKKDLTSSFSKELLEQKFSNCTAERGLAYKETKEILDKVCALLSEKTGFVYTSYQPDWMGTHGYSYHHSRLSGLSDRGDDSLLTLQTSLVDILAHLTVEHEKSTTVDSRALRTLLAALLIIKRCSSSGSSFYLPAAVTASIMLPFFKKSKHLLGLTTGVVLYSTSGNSVTALGAGVVTSVIAHNVPIIDSLFKKAVIRTEPAIYTGLKKTCEAVDKARPVIEAVLTNAGKLIGKAYDIPVEFLKNQIFARLNTSVIQPNTPEIQPIGKFASYIAESGSAIAGKIAEKAKDWMFE